MSVKTLDAVQAVSTAALTPKRLTYSIPPSATATPTAETVSDPVELSVFLEQENPLGCIRGVFWVMAFNALVFLTALSAWAAFRYLR